MRITKTFATTFAAALLAGGVAHAQLVFTKIVETGDPVPGSPGATFTDIGSESPSIDGDDVAFAASFENGVFNQGMFSFSGGSLNKIVFASDTIPSGGATFTSFDDNSVLVSGGQVSFRGGVGAGRAFYIAPVTGAGPVTTIADQSTAIPDGSGDLFTDFQEHGRDGVKTLFEAEGPSGQNAMYLSDNGVLSIVADLSTPSLFPTGGGTLTGFGEPAIRGDNLSFTAGDTVGGRGLLAEFGSGLQVVAEVGTAAPNGGNFFGFDESSIDGDLIVWQGNTDGAGGNGVFQYDDATQTISAVADYTTPVPGGAGNFTGFVGDPSISGNNVLFEANDGNGAIGIYLSVDGVLNKLAVAGEMFDGKIVSRTDSRIAFAASGDKAGFSLDFTDGSAAVYVVTVIPEPASAALLALAGFAPAARRSRVGQVAPDAFENSAA